MSTQRGNVLFLILIGVVLFAALSYAVTATTRSGAKDMSDDKAQLTANMLMQFGTSVQNGINRMIVTNHCQDTEISFETPILLGYVNASAPSNYKCHVFRPEGGGVVAVTPKSLIKMSSTNNNLVYTGSLNVLGVGTSAPELVLVVHLVGPKVCSKIMAKTNRLPVASVDFDGVSSATGFTGSYTLTGTIGDNTGINYGQAVGCFTDGYTFTHYYQVLLAR